MAEPRQPSEASPRPTLEDSLDHSVDGSLDERGADVVDASVERVPSRAAETAETLLELARDFATLGGPREIAQRIAAAVPKIIDADASAVVSLDRAEGVLKVEGLWGWPEELAEGVAGFQLPLDASPLIDVLIAQARPVYVTPSIGDPVITAVLTEFETDAALVVPISVRGRVLGFVAGVKRGTAPAEMSPELAERAQGLADFAAAALDNARLYAAVQEQLARVEQSEAVARDATAALAHLLESGPVVTFRGSAEDFHCTYVSQNVERVFGYGPEAFLRLNWLDLVHPDDHADVWEQAQRAQHESEVTFGARMRDGDGRYRWLQIHLRADLDERAEGGEILGYVWDETERKEAEERYRRVSRITSDVAYAYRLDPDGGAELEWGTSGIEAITGYTEAEAIAMGGWPGLVIPDDRPAIAEHRLRVRRGEPAEGEFRVRTRDGVIRWLEITDTPVAADGGSIRIFGAARDVTARREAEQALAEREAELQAAQSLAHIGNWRVDAEMQLIEWSPEMRRIFGWEADEQPDTAWLVSRVHPDDLPALTDHMAEAAVGDRVPECEFRIIRPDGAVRWLHQRTEAGFDEGGQLRTYKGVTQDVTERHQAEELRRLIADAISDAAFTYAVVDGELVLDWVSDAWGRLTGYEFDSQVPRQLFLPVVHPDDLEIARMAEDRVLRGEPTVDEFRVRAADSSIRWLRIYAIPVRDDVSGDVVRVYGAAQDVTDRRMAEEAVIESEARLRQLIQASPLAIVVFSADGRVTSMNPAAEELFGWSLDEVRRDHDGRAPWVMPEHQDEYDLMAARLAAGERTVGFETKRRRRDGELVDVAISVGPLDRGPAQAGEAVAVILDISERVRLEEELRQAQKMNAIGRLAGGVAHDFNNILTAVMGHAEFLLEEPVDEPLVREHAEGIRGAAERAAALTEQLLLVSRHRPPVAETLDLNEEVGAMHDMLGRLVGDRIDLDVRLWHQPCLVRLPRPHLQQVILNLAVNGLDSMPDGGSLLLETCVEARPDAPVAVLRVSDTGEGIEAGVRDRIFEPFFTTKESGVGLGLSMVYGIVDGNGGEIVVESSPGAGTTMEVCLPLAGELVPADAGGRVPPVAAAGRENILLVEDEEAVRLIAAEAMRRRGYHVIEACDALEALTLVEAATPTVDLLVTDIVMPHMGGTALAERLRARAPGMRVLFISGYAETRPVERAAGNGDAGFLQKPFRPEELLDAVRRVLDGLVVDSTSP